MKCAIQTVRTRWHRIARCRAFGFVAKANWAFKARGVAGQVLVKPNDAI
jgi:hypothetical protein